MSYETDIQRRIYQHTIDVVLTVKNDPPELYEILTKKIDRTSKSISRDCIQARHDITGKYVVLNLSTGEVEVIDKPDPRVRDITPHPND